MGLGVSEFGVQLQGLACEMFRASGFEGSTLFVSAVNQTGLHSPPAPGCLVQFDFKGSGSRRLSVQALNPNMLLWDGQLVCSNLAKIAVSRKREFLSPRV